MVDGKAGIYAKLTLVAIVWGASFVAGRIVSAEMGAVTAALWRYVIAATTLVAVALLVEHGLPRLTAKQWLGVVVLGILGVTTYNLCFMYGLQTVPASRASLIIALNPAATLVGGAMFLREPLSRDRIAGIALALIGVAVELSGGNPAKLFEHGSLLGELAMFGCVLSWAAYTLLGKRVLGDYDGVRAIGPARTAVFINLVPIVAIALSVSLLGEKLVPSMVIGAALVVSGVFIVNRAPTASPVVRHMPCHTG